LRIPIILCAILLLFTACTDAPSPVTPSSTDDNVCTESLTRDIYGNHVCWGEYTLYFSGDHESVAITPKRQGRFHLNTLRFLEEYCTDCLEITNINNNGDGTIDMTVRITHPFPDNPEYTGFDVKGIIMFHGSHEVLWVSQKIWPYGSFDNLNTVIVSWAELGDPEVLNADGYSPLWTGYWESGSDMPIFNYWPGKYSKGSPNAKLNAFLNFHTDEERHMFRVNGHVDRTYHISLPPGPVTAGYAIDACWEPPDVTPITDPASDFPITANQDEPYYFRFIVNNDEPITFEPCCGTYDGCSEMRIEFSDWYGETPRHDVISFQTYPGWMMGNDNNMPDCDDFVIPGVNLLIPSPRSITDFYESDGNYRGVAALYKSHVGYADQIAYDVFDITIDLE